MVALTKKKVALTEKNVKYLGKGHVRHSQKNAPQIEESVANSNSFKDGFLIDFGSLHFTCADDGARAFRVSMMAR